MPTRPPRMTAAARRTTPSPTEPRGCRQAWIQASSASMVMRITGPPKRTLRGRDRSPSAGLAAAGELLVLAGGGFEELHGLVDVGDLEDAGGSAAGGAA